MSVRAGGSERTGGPGGLLQAPLAAPPAAQQLGARSGAAAPRRHREGALKDGEGHGALAACPSHGGEAIAR